MMTTRSQRLLLLVSVLVAACGSATTNGGADSDSLPVAEDAAPATTAPSPETGPPDTAASATPAPVADRDDVSLCADIPQVMTTVLAPPGTGEPDEVFLGVVNSYIEEHRDTFGGAWIDRDAGGTFVVGFTDEPGPHLSALMARAANPADIAVIEPPPVITDDRPIGEWGVPLDVVQLSITEDALRASLDRVFSAVQAADIGLNGASPDIKRGRVSLMLLEPTNAALAELARVVDPNLVCVEGELIDPARVTPQPGDELNVIISDDRTAVSSLSDDTQVSCGTWPFRLGDLTNPTMLADSDMPDLLTAFEGSMSQLEFTGVFGPQVSMAAEDWIVLPGLDGFVQLAHVVDDSFAAQIFEPSRVGWSWAGSSGGGGGGCKVLLPDGLGVVEWELDSEAPAPTPEATSFDVLATEQACSGARTLGDQLLGPQVVETADSVLIAFAAIPPIGGQECPGNPSTRVTIELDAPLGDRAIVDGLTVSASIGSLLPD